MRKLNIFTPPPKNTQHNASFTLNGRKLKRTAIAFSLMLCFSLAACSSSDAGQSSEENQETAPSPSQTESEDESSEDSTISPDLQESIISICPNASIYETDGSISVDMTEEYEKFSADLIYDCAHIIGTSRFSEEYPGISFSYLTDDLSFFLTISDFQDISSYTTTLTCTGNDSNQIAAAQLLYDNLFYNHDVGNKQLIEQGKIADKYGVDGGDAVAEAQPEDELWFYSFFDDSVLHSFENGIFAINYRVDTDDIFQYGYDAWGEFENAISYFPIYFSEDMDLISLDQIVLICFDGQSDTRLFECTCDRQENNSFQVNNVNYMNDEFKEGVISKYNELHE